MTKRLHAPSRRWRSALTTWLALGVASAGTAGGQASLAATTFPLRAPADRPRLLVLTDIGGDPDDQQSLVRLLVSSNQFEIEGLIATATRWRASRPESVNPRLITEAVAAYAKTQANLSRHADGFPTANQLLAVVRSGATTRGRPTAGPTQRSSLAFGEGLDTEASKLIIAAIDRGGPRPLNICIWGGQVDLAQALWRVKHDRGVDGLAKFVRRLRVYDIGDQAEIAQQMWSDFPGMKYVLSTYRGLANRSGSPHHGMYSGGDESLTSQAWIHNHVRTGHGPLGELYPAKTNTFTNRNNSLKEGDTPSFFYFLPTALSDPDHPEWGGWGGRFVPDPMAGGGYGHIYRDAVDTVERSSANPGEGAKATVFRWREAFQAEFQARMDWCVKPPGEANHAPVAAVNGDTTRDVLHITAKPGDVLEFSAGSSVDPEAHSWAARFWFYREAGNVDAVPELRPGPDTLSTRFTVPALSGDGTLHLILEVRDTGTPPLSDFRRVIVSLR